MNTLLEAMQALNGKGRSNFLKEDFEAYMEPENIVAVYDVYFTVEDEDEDEDTVYIWKCPDTKKYIISGEYFDYEDLENKYFNTPEEALEAYKKIASKGTTEFRVEKGTLDEK